MEMASEHRNDAPTAARVEQLEHLPNKEGVRTCQIRKAARAAAAPHRRRTPGSSQPVIENDETEDRSRAYLEHRIRVVHQGLLARGRRVQRYVR